jgi:hypothetical protein
MGCLVVRIHVTHFDRTSAHWQVLTDVCRGFLAYVSSYSRRIPACAPLQPPVCGFLYCQSSLRHPGVPMGQMQALQVWRDSTMT